MQLPRCLELTSLLFALSSKGSNPEAQSSGSGTNAIDESRKQDLNRLKSQEENLSVAHENDNLNNLLSEDEIYCYKTCSFRCPNDKKLFNIRHLIPIYYHNYDNPALSITCFNCDSCGENLYGEILNFKYKFIEYFIMNPQKEFLGTLFAVLVTTDVTKIIEKIFIENEVSDSSLELLFDMLYPDTRYLVQKFKRNICNAALLSKENKISPEIFEKIVSEIKTNSDNVLELLSKNLEHIKLFSDCQRSHMFDLLLGTNFTDPKTKSDAIFHLFESFSECKLFWNLNEYVKIELSIFALKEKSIEGLKLLNALNYNPFLDNDEDESKISKLLYSLFAEFEHEREHKCIFFQAIKIFNHNLLYRNPKIDFLVNYAPPNMILTADYEFLRDYFDEDFFFGILVRYFKNVKTTEKAMNYFFENVVGRTSSNPFKLIGGFFWTLNLVENSTYLQYFEVLKIFLSTVKHFDVSTIHVMIEAYNSYKEANGSDISGVFSLLCSRFSISEELQEPFKRILGEDDI